MNFREEVHTVFRQTACLAILVSYLTICVTKSGINVIGRIITIIIFMIVIYPLSRRNLESFASSTGRHLQWKCGLQE